ncbi:MAG: MarR family transcriptional regulator [Verrucomicrobia bacterium]|nr:MarR family transcriptional regulator [Verrucomicrobiota bacterium]MCH8511738.1 MarR family transcriptional regulator [Kiritimatiellia bacterium]
MNALETVENELGFIETGMGDALETMLVFNLLRTHSYLGPFLDADLRQQRVTAAQFNALLVLRDAGEEGLKMGEIGERLVVTKSNVTGLVDRLERQKLVCRTERPDRRATSVGITPSGLSLLQDVIPRHQRLLVELTDGLTETEKKTLITLLTKLRRILRQRKTGAI